MWVEFINLQSFQNSLENIDLITNEIRICGFTFYFCIARLNEYMSSICSERDYLRIEC